MLFLMATPTGAAKLAPPQAPSAADFTGELNTASCLATIAITFASMIYSTHTVGSKSVRATAGPRPALWLGRALRASLVLTTTTLAPRVRR